MKDTSRGRSTSDASSRSSNTRAFGSVDTSLAAKGKEFRSDIGNRTPTDTPLVDNIDIGKQSQASKVQAGPVESTFLKAHSKDVTDARPKYMSEPKQDGQVYYGSNPEIMTPGKWTGRNPDASPDHGHFNRSTGFHRNEHGEQVARGTDEQSRITVQGVTEALIPGK